jgi:hypothetical protein
MGLKLGELRKEKIFPEGLGGVGKKYTREGVQIHFERVQIHLSNFLCEGENFFEKYLHAEGFFFVR